MGLNKLVWVMLLVFLLAAVFVVYRGNLPNPLASANSVDGVLARNGLDKEAFFSGKLIGLGVYEPTVDAAKLAQAKTDFENLLPQTSGVSEQATVRLAIDLTDFYQKKQGIKNESAFFQQETDGAKLCANQAKAVELVERQKNLYYQLLEIFSNNAELQTPYGSVISQLTPSSEYAVWQELKTEAGMLELSCVKT